VEAIYEDHINVRGGTKRFLTEPICLLDIDLDFKVGDEVLIDRQNQPNWRLLDVWIDERPAHPDLLSQYVFPKILDTYE
jgi:hypothetical protein